MQKKITDYLHLYLGCEVAVESEGYKPGNLKLVGLENHDGRITCKVEDTGIKISWFANIHSVKPVLRLLSDITKEEAKHMGFKNVEELNDHEHEYFTYQPEQVKYMLSIGLDLFNLIDSGLAIDKATLNP